MTHDFGPESSDGFVGRDSELAILEECLQAARHSIPWLVVVQGRAGIGKTALIRHALHAHEELTVWWAGCTSSEQDWPLGTLDQLLRRVDRTVYKDHPALQALAPSSSAVEIGAQLLQLIGQMEQTAPLVIVVDDAHWIDDASMKVLSFVARRLTSDRVMIILAARDDLPDTPDPVAPWTRLTAGAERARTLTVEGLGTKDVARLAALNGHVLPVAAARRLQRHTEGHPLYVQAVVADAWAAQSLTDLDGPLTVPSSLSGTIVRHLDRLPPDSRALMEALAVLNARVPLAVAAQVAELGDPDGALAPLLPSGLVQWWPVEPTTPVQIRHTLLREAIYQALSPVRRRAMHRACVPVADHSTSWAHRVAASGGGDSVLIGDLQAEARRQTAAGRLERAATLLLWAADLCEDRTSRDENMLTAAAHLVIGDSFGRALRLREAVERCQPSALRSAVLGQLAQHTPGGVATAERHLAEAAEAAAAADDAWVQTLATMWLGSLYTSLGDGEAALAPARQALDSSFPYPRMRHSAQSLLVNATLMRDGPQAGLRLLHSLIPDAPQAPHTPPLDTALLRPRALCEVLTGDLHSAREDLNALIDRTRAGYSPTVYPADHYMLAICQYLLGEWDNAAVAADYALTLNDVEELPYGLAPASAVAAAVAAGRGRWQEAALHCRVALPRMPRPVDRLYALLAQAIVAQARAEPTAMRTALLSLHHTAPGFLKAWQLWWLPLETEALIGSHQLPEAGQRLEQLEGFAASSPTTTACLHSALALFKGGLAEARRDPTAARDIYSHALEGPAPVNDMPLYRALLHHAFGRLLLATADRRSAADQLRRAHRTFTALDAVPFLERTAADLTACGLHPPDRAGGGNDLTALTEREHSVAHLAAQGHTNQEIATELYVSIKTVEYHLGHVYTKLGLSSRRQLHKALGRQESDTPTQAS